MSKIFKGVGSSTDPPKIDEERKLYAIHLDSGESEYKIFKKAYETWHGEGDVEYAFDRYLFQEEIPSYVRDYIRKYKFKEQEGGSIWQLVVATIGYVLRRIYEMLH
jgi:hypothetical protein